MFYGVCSFFGVNQAFAAAEQLTLAENHKIIRCELLTIENMDNGRKIFPCNIRSLTLYQEKMKIMICCENCPEGNHMHNHIPGALSWLTWSPYHVYITCQQLRVIENDKSVLETKARSIA